jgi:hypothetical protein
MQPLWVRLRPWVTGRHEGLARAAGCFLNAPAAHSYHGEVARSAPQNGE